MPERKLTEQDCKDIYKLLEKGMKVPALARQYGVDKSLIYRRVKFKYQGNQTPLEIRNKVFKALQEGYTKAEAAQMYGLNIGTVQCFTSHFPGYKHQGNHIVRPQGIKLLNRLMTDGYVITGFVLSTMRVLQQKFPVIRYARYKDKGFFYLPGREKETIEAFFREMPERVINYRAIEELSYLLGVPVSKSNTHTLYERYKNKHNDYWRSQWLIQRCLEDFFTIEELGFTQSLSRPPVKFFKPGKIGKI